MRKPEIHQLFDRMSCRMSEIQQCPVPLFHRIALDNGTLNQDAADHHLLQDIALSLSNLTHMVQTPLIIGCVPDQSVLKHLSHTARELRIIQGLQGFRVQIDQGWLMKCPDHILVRVKIDAGLTAEKKAEVDVLSANLMASSDALAEVTAREAAGNARPAEKLDAEIECLTNYTAILAAVPSPENETLLADKKLELQSAREDRLFLAQKEFEEGKIDSDQLRELEEKFVKADVATEAEPVKAAKEKKKEPFWGYKKHKPLPYLVIIANYRIPRKVIAEYLRTKYDVPYILLPSDPGKPSKDDQVYFSGGKKNSGELEVVHTV